MQEIFRNKYLNYGYIVSLTLLVLILVFNIFQGNFTRFTGSIKLSTRNIKLVMLLILLVTYITLVTPSVRMLIQSKVILKTPPRGDRGGRGNRGIVGKNAACSECGDDLCYKKMLYNITNTINFWKQENGFEKVDFFPDNYVIPNEYIKDKIKKHCASKEFKELLSKYGSNNKSNKTDVNDLIAVVCPSGLDGGCGAYDYMFKMWSIWILIILRYKNGLFFLEAEGLNEADFEGLIDKEDGFKLGDMVVYSSVDYTIANNEEFPFFKLNNGASNSGVHVNSLTYKGTDTLLSWGGMFDETYITPTTSACNNTDDLETEKEKKQAALACRSKQAHQIKSDDVTVTTNNFIQQLEVVKKNDGVYEFKTSNHIPINTAFIKKIGHVPGGGKHGPFEEIKKYRAWRWGSDNALKPKFTIINKSENKICETCWNSSLCDSSNNTGGLKFKFSNSYKQLVDTQIFDNEEGVDDFLIPFKPLDTSTKSLGTDPVSFFRPQVLIDDIEEPYFREYKPLGDVLLKNSEYVKGSEYLDEHDDGSAQIVIGTDIEKCAPNNNNFYDEEIFTTILGKDGGDRIGDIPSQTKPSNFNPHIHTLLVAGDTKPPTGYTRLENFVINKTMGTGSNNKHIPLESITIWKPIVTDDKYVACGYVIDKRPYKAESHSSQPMPPLDLIATIPKGCLNEYPFNQLKINADAAIGDFKRSWFNLFYKTSNISEINGEITKADSDKDNDPYKYDYLCTPKTDKPTINNDEIEVINRISKDKKYSILKIYDN